MNRVKKKSIGDKLGVIYAVLLFAFIYIPTVIVVVYSFNQQPRTSGGRASPPSGTASCSGTRSCGSPSVFR